MSRWPAPGSALQRLGYAPIPEHRSVIVAVPDIDACRDIEAVLSWLRSRHDRLFFYFIPGRPTVRDWLDRRYPGAAVLAAPLNNRLSALVFLLTSRARLVLGLGDLGSLPTALVKQAYALGMAIAVIDAEAPEAGVALPADKRRLAALAPLVDWWQPRDEAHAAGLRSLGLAGERIADPKSGLDPLNALMARRPPNRRPLQRLIAAGFDRPMWRRVLGLRARRIDSLDELRATLGNPHTILCLGSGPSSEDPSLAEAKFDCLFRVNHRWLDRGLLCQPDMVFTGQKRTLFTLRGPIFAFQTRRAEGQLVTHQVFNPLCGRMRFVTLERLAILPGLDWDGIRPTNGATMLATAVALRPRRLIVAGIDLFADPAGAYPGDNQTPNAYVPVHEPGLEADFILRTLAAYDGELVILGKVLAERWKATSPTTQRKRGVPV